MVTPEQVQAYETVRVSGLTNMWDWKRVRVLARHMTGVDLNKEAIGEIMRDYGSLMQKHVPRRYQELVERTRGG